MSDPLRNIAVGEEADAIAWRDDELNALRDWRTRAEAVLRRVAGECLTCGGSGHIPEIDFHGRLLNTLRPCHVCYSVRSEARELLP